MRESKSLGGWFGSVMLIAVLILVLSQHAEGERTRAELKTAQGRVDQRIRTLDARLTDMQVDASRRRLAASANPPLDPKRMARASKELDRLINATPPAPRPAPPVVAEPPRPQLEAEPDALAAVARDWVRVCKGGRYYHRFGCKRVQKVTRAIDRADAVVKGWDRCPTCLP